MIFGSLFTALLLTTAAFAVPEGRRSRGSAGHQSNPLQRLSGNTDLKATNVTYTSSNWAGAVWNSYPPNTFYKVTGTFTVPTPNAPNGKASVWVGIDGNSCKTILQTGIYISYQNGAVSYDSWYEWLPNLSHSYDSPIAIRAGDVIRLTVTASSTTSGTTLIENLTTGQSESQSPSSPSYPLCLQNAEWIVEDFNAASGMVPFCDFGTVAFSSASAYLHNGQAISPNGAMVLNIEQNGKVLTSVSESSSGTVTIKYL
ncbi:Peptidase A4 family domain containing protein [Amanita muscaria]